MYAGITKRTHTQRDVGRQEKGKWESDRDAENENAEERGTDKLSVKRVRTDFS